MVAFRRHTLLPLDDCLYALQPSILHQTRSALHRCLQFQSQAQDPSDLTPHEYIAKIWTSEPDRFILNPSHQMPGLNA